MKRHTAMLMAVIPLLAAGCEALRTDTAAVTPAQPWMKASGRYPASDSESLLMYFEYVRKLPAPDLAREHDAVRQLFAESRSDFNRVRYAMVLSVPGAAFGDDARAQEVLDPLLKNPDAALHNVAFVANAQIQEQRRGKGLQQKLDALKALEKNLIERGDRQR